MTGSRSLLLSLALACAIGLALYVVLSPTEAPLPAPNDPDQSQQAEAALEVAEPTDPTRLAGTNPQESSAAVREASQPDSSPVDPANGPRAMVSLRVLDAEGQAIAGARLRGASMTDEADLDLLGLFDWDADDSKQAQAFGEALSSQDGTLEFDVPADCKLLLELSAAGFATSMRECEQLAADQRLELGEVRLSVGAELRIEVQDATGLPLPGLQVVAWYGESIPLVQTSEFPIRELAVANTDAQGLARFEGLPDVPSRDIEIWGEKLQSPLRIEKLGPSGDESRHQRYVLPPASQITGRVLDREGMPIEGATVIVFDPGFSRDWVDVGTEAKVAELLDSRPGLSIGIGEGMLDVFSKLTTDANGQFVQNYFVNPDEVQGETLVYAAIAIVSDSVVVESKWHRVTDEVTLTIPRSFHATGRFVDASGQALANARLRFQARLDLRQDDEQAEEADGVFLLDRSPFQVQPDGSFDVSVPSDRYWIEVNVPGGRHLFEGPYDLRSSDLNLGDLVVPFGRRVQLTAIPSDGGASLTGLRGVRHLPEDAQDESLQDVHEVQPDQESTFDEQERVWMAEEQSAAIDGLVAAWTNQTEGTWEYTLAAPGWVPAFVTLEVQPGDSWIEREVPMTRAGSVEVQVLTSDGVAPDNLLLELRPVQDLPAHPHYERRAEGLPQDRWYQHDRQPIDADSQAKFSHVLPGSYELIAMTSAEANQWFSDDEDSRAALARVEVLAGETTKVDASLAQLAELTVTVTRNGTPVYGAQVFADKRPNDERARAMERFGFHFGSEEPVGSTNAQGQIVLASLTPNASYELGARVPAAESERWIDEDAWTRVVVDLQAGPQSATIELATGAVRLQVTGVNQAAIDIKLARLRQIPELSPDASEAEREFHAYTIANVTEESVEDLFDSSTVARRMSTSGKTIEFFGLPPGEYQVMVQTESEDARGISAKFQVDGQAVDIGTIHLVPLGLVQIQLFGLNQIDPEELWAFDLDCVPAAGGNAVKSNGWLPQSGTFSWHLPAGSYILELSQNHELLGSSPPFSVVSGGTTPVNWTIPEPRADD